MKVYEEPYQLRLPRDPNRSEGLHLSDVLRDLAFKSRLLDTKYDKPVEDEGSEMMQLGMAWEDYLAKYQHKECDFHPGEVLYQGIAMSPDAVQLVDDEDLADTMEIDTDSLVLREYKLTRKSSRGFKDELRMQSKKCLLWLWQIKAYRYALNQTCKSVCCDTAFLHVLFVNGGYGFGGMSVPEYKIYRLVFDAEDLENTWAMIQSHAACMKEGGRDGERR